MNWPASTRRSVLLALACVVLIVDLFVDRRRARIDLLADAGDASRSSPLLHLVTIDGGATAYGMHGMFVADPMGHLLALLRRRRGDGHAGLRAAVRWRTREMLKGEFFTLTLFALLGISVMFSANHLLVVYLGLELMCCRSTRWSRCAATMRSRPRRR